MRTLYHLWLSPQCRAVRVLLGEKKIEAKLKVEKVWTRRKAFLALNPAGRVPVLVEEGGGALVGFGPIVEYVEETIQDPPLLCGPGDPDPQQRAETRRLVGWFTDQFDAEVVEPVVGEKLMKRFLGLGQPDAATIRAGLRNLRTHLAYIGWLMERRKWLAGDWFSLADIAAGAALSCVDYVGDVPWEDFPEAKAWYQRIKSRPTFRPLLGDHIPGAPPPKHYADLDF